MFTSVMTVCHLLLVDDFLPVAGANAVYRVWIFMMLDGRGLKVSVSVHSTTDLLL